MDYRPERHTPSDGPCPPGESSLAWLRTRPATPRSRLPRGLLSPPAAWQRPSVADGCRPFPLSVILIAVCYRQEETTGPPGQTAGATVNTGPEAVIRNEPDRATWPWRRSDPSRSVFIGGRRSVLCCGAGWRASGPCRGRAVAPSDGDGGAPSAYCYCAAPGGALTRLCDQHPKSTAAAVDWMRGRGLPVCGESGCRDGGYWLVSERRTAARPDGPLRSPDGGYTAPKCISGVESKGTVETNSRL